MADDQNQRAYRGGDAASRGAAAGNGLPASDPLAELARLIGQTDPFAEYGRNNSQRAPTVPGAQPAQAWPGEPAGQPSAADLHAYSDAQFSNGGFGRQAFGAQTAAPSSPELYPVEAHAPGYASPGYETEAYPAGAAPGYDQAFPPSQEPLHDVHQQFGPAQADDYYDDVAPSRRRVSVLAIAGVFALAVIGTAGALGYRSMFGPSSAPTTPPVIKAEATPSKVVPAAASKEPGKVTDRVGGNGQVERLLSREEQPMPVATTPNPPPPNTALASAGAPVVGSGVVGEPRKIRTIPIRPDQAGDTSSTPAEPSPAQPPARVSNNAPPAESPPARVTPQPEPRAAAPAPRLVATQTIAAPAAPSSNAPLSLNPNAPAAQPARPARVAAQTPAPQAAAPAAASTGGYAVQVSAQRSEAEAQAAFQALQGKYPGQLGGRAPYIKRVDLGDKGIYFRAMVAVGSSGEASELCSSLKAAGASCIVQRN